MSNEEASNSHNCSHALKSNEVATPYADDTDSATCHFGPADAPSLADTCLSRTLKIVFSTPGLVALVVLYSVLGAVLFPLLEAPQDASKSAMIAKSREECLRELWTITEKLNVLYEKNWTMLVHEQLRRFEGTIVAASRSGIGSGPPMPGERSIDPAYATTTRRHADAFEASRWSFSEALLYSVTVITTIGHGNLTPKTAAGKIATILYALFGVPLMLMCLSSLGALLAEALQCTYARICCRLASSRHGQHHHHHHHHSQGQHLRLRRDHGNIHASRSRSGSGSGARGPEAAGHEIEQQQQHYHEEAEADNEDGVMRCGSPANQKEPPGGDCFGHTAAMDSKSFKYDSAAGLRKLSNANDYCCQSEGVVRAIEDAKQPDKMAAAPHSPCVQVTAMGCPAALHKLHVPQQQQFPYSHNSPSHFTHPHPHSMQTFHIVSGSASTTVGTSASSSPTHQTLLRPYGTLQAHPHWHGHGLQQQQQQHYVAVPSSLVRFQVPSMGNCVEVGVSNEGRLPANCFQPATVAVTGAATIFFPTVTSGPPPPLVKYHTIQLQPKRAPDSLPRTNDNSGTMQMPLPLPPLAYQTATVHGDGGLRRVKYVTKPLPPAINIDLTAAELSCGHDLLPTQAAQQQQQQQQAPAIKPSGPHRGADAAIAAATLSPMAATATSTPTPTTTTTTAFISASVSASVSMPDATTAPTYAASVPAAPAPAPVPTSVTATGTATATPTAAATAAAACSASLGSNTTVDIMEDEEEHEQQRIGNCPHGTPSRIPLIPADEGRSGAAAGNYLNRPKDGEKYARSRLNTTAASFHRHTLHTFQRGAPTRYRTPASSIADTRAAHSVSRKSVAFANSSTASVNGRRAEHRKGCVRAMTTAGGCYGNRADTSEDEYDDEEHGTRTGSGSGLGFGFGIGVDVRRQRGAKAELFALQAFQGSSNNAIDADAEADADTDAEADADADAADEEDDDNHRSSEPQVPISIVVLILMCYISLGSMVFALWENWSIIDSSYFCFVTLATIGYGDFIPERTFRGPNVQLFACCAYLLLGLVLVAMAFSILESQLLWKCRRIAVRLKLAAD